MRWMLLAVLSLGVATCGQKGPLFLPEDAEEPDAAVHGAAQPFPQP